MSWPMVELGDVSEVVSGATPKREVPAYWNGDVDWVTPKDLTDLEGRYIDEAPEKITEAGYKSCSTHLVPAGSVLLSSRAPIGHLAITKRPVCTNQGFKNFVPGPNVDAEFLYWALKRDVPKLQAMGTGSTFKEISKAQVEKYQIPLPPLPTQRRIAAVLDKAQALVANDKRTLAVYDQLAKSLFLEMFGDPVRNEKGWEVVKLKDACDQITDGSHFSPPMVAKGYPYVSARHIKEYGLDFAAAPMYVDEEHHAEIYRRCKPVKGDVLYIKDGATTGIAAINTMDEPFSLLSSVALFKPNKTILSGTYLCYWLNHQGVRQNLIRTHMAGAAIQRFTLDKINRFEIMLPPLKPQQRFERVIERIQDQRASTMISLRRSEGLFGSLLQRAFAGGLG